jgi:hypothetical protein
MKSMAEPRGPRSSRSNAGGGASGRAREGGAGSGVAAEATASTMRGVVLVLVAVVVGIVLLQVVDDGDAPKQTSPGSKDTTTTVDDSGETTTPTTADGGALIPAAELEVQVLNGRGVTGVAGQMTEALTAKGYTSMLDPKDAERREGNIVTCQPGLEGEAALLVTQVGDAKVEAAYPDPLPANASPDAQCLVILGTAAAA